MIEWIVVKDEARVDTIVVAAGVYEAVEIVAEAVVEVVVVVVAVDRNDSSCSRCIGSS